MNTLTIVSIIYCIALLYPLGTLPTRVVNILFTLDCFLFSAFTLGRSWPGESFSSAAYRAEILSKPYGKSRIAIDWIFSWLGQKEHCKTAYLMAKYNLPEDQR